MGVTFISCLFLSCFCKIQRTILYIQKVRNFKHKGLQSVERRKHEHSMWNQSVMISRLEFFCFSAIKNHFNLRQSWPCCENNDVVLRPDTCTGNILFYERRLIPNLFASILCVDVKHEFRCQFMFLVSELWLSSIVQSKFSTSKKSWLLCLTFQQLGNCLYLTN